MAELVLGVVVGNNCGGITPSDNDGRTTCSSLDVRIEEVFRTPGESWVLEHAGRSMTTHQYIHFVASTRYLSVVVKWKEKGLHVPVPEDCLRLSDRLTIQLAALRSDIESKPPIGNTTLVRRRACLGVLVELVGGDVVDWENELDAFGLGLFYQSSNLLGSRLVEEGVADLWGWSVSGKTGGKDGAWKGRTLTPSRVFLKVKAMPPVIMSEST